MISDYDYNLSKAFDSQNQTFITVSCNKDGLTVISTERKTCDFYVTNENGEYTFQRKTNLHDNVVYVIKDDVACHGFFTGGKDANIIYMNNEGIPLGEYTEHKETISSISQSEEDSSRLVSGAFDTTAKVWDIESQQLLHDLKGHSGGVACLGLSRNRVITASLDRTINFWDNGKKYLSIDEAHDDLIRDIVLSPDLKSFYTSSNDNSIKQWTFDGKLIKKLEGHNGCVCSLTFNHDTCQLFSCGEDNVVKIWNNEGKFHQDLLHPDCVLSCSYNFFNGDLLTVCEKGVLRLWTFDENRFPKQEVMDEYNSTCKVNALKRKEKPKVKNSSPLKPQEIHQQTSMKNDNFNSNTNSMRNTFDSENNFQSNNSNNINSFNNLISEPQNLFSNQPFPIEDTEEQDVDINKHPQIQILIMTNDFEDGQIIKIFYRGQSRKYRYDSSQRKFFSLERPCDNCSSTMSNSHQKEKMYYKGDSFFPAGNYDYVFYIKYLPGVQAILPINKNDNIDIVCKKFMKRQNLPQHLRINLIFLVQQRMKEIQMAERNPLENQNNMMGQLIQAIMLKESMNSLGNQNLQMLQQELNNSDEIDFPIMEYSVYKSVYVEIPLKKITEINEALINKPECISKTQLEQIKNVLDLIGNESAYGTSTFNDSDLKEFLRLLILWKDEHLIPIFDLYRMLLLHPKINYFFALPEGGVNELNQCLSYIKVNINIKLTSVLMRILCNHFVNDNSRELMRKKREEILTLINNFVDNDNENIRSAVIRLLFNYSILFWNGTDSEAALQIIMLVIDLIQSEKKSDNIVVLLKTIGNLICTSETNKMMIMEMGLPAIVNNINVRDDNADIVNQIKLFITLTLR